MILSLGQNQESIGLMFEAAVILYLRPRPSKIVLISRLKV